MKKETAMKKLMSADRPLWKLFKRKWDNGVPKKGTLAYKEYVYDCKQATEEAQKIVDSGQSGKGEEDERKKIRD